MKLKEILFVLVFMSQIPGAALAQDTPPAGIFQAPVRIPMVLSATFGELRAGHFHSGIDIKTQGKTGLPVYACASGYISRINVSPDGFGKALYIAHPNGYTTVYAHLYDFMPAVEKWVREEQYRQKQFPVNLFPPASMFPVGAGEQIAWSGNTGSSAGPHLHFEVRDSRSQNPLDPLLFFPGIPDDMPPIFQHVCLYPLQPGTLVDGSPVKKEYPVNGSRGNYRLPASQPLPVTGSFGVGVEVFDYLNHSWNKCGISTLEVQLDQQRLYSHRINEFSFAETRYINSHIDYAEKVTSGRNIQKTFLQPNNRLSIYREVVNRGRINLPDSLPHRVRIVAGDAHGNQSSLEFQVQLGRGQSLVNPPARPGYVALFPWETVNSYQSEGFSLEMPARALYDSIYFSYARTPAMQGYYSPVHHIDRETTPVHLFFDIRVRTSDVPPGLEGKLLLVRLNDQDEMESAGGTWEDGWIQAKIRDFGRYTVVMDTLAPEIRPVNIRDGKHMTGLGTIEIEAKDDLSGISSYHGYIDNQWALFEYDPKNDLLVYRFDPERLQPDSWHELVLTVNDGRNNFSVYHARFFW